MLNVVVLQGRITHELELRTTQNGKSIIYFSIAADRGFGDNKTTDFFDCVALGKTAEFVSNFFAKGKAILIKGRLETSVYNDAEGNKRKSFRINAESVEFCGNKSDNQQRQDFPEDTGTDAELSIFADDDLPFV